MQLYQAQYIYPVSAPPRSPGIIAVDGERIAAVGTTAEMTQRYPGAPVTDLGSVMLMPQAVNAHTHLELTALAAMGKQPLADRSFLAWIDAASLHTRRCQRSWHGLSAWFPGTRQTGKIRYRENSRGQPRPWASSPDSRRDAA